MNKKILILIGVLVIIFGYVLINKGSSYTSVNNTEQKDSQDLTSTSTTTTTKTTTTKPKTVTGTITTTNSGKCNVTITYPKPGASVTFPLVVQGYIDNTKTTSCSWYENQLRAGEVQVSYNLRNEGWKVSGVPVPIITNGNSQSTSTSMFTVSLSLLTKPLGITSGTPIKLTFTELKNAANPNPNPDHFDLNVYIK